MTDDDDLGCLFVFTTGAIILILLIFCTIKLVAN